ALTSLNMLRQDATTPYDTPVMIHIYKSDGSENAAAPSRNEHDIFFTYPPTFFFMYPPTFANLMFRMRSSAVTQRARRRTDQTSDQRSICASRCWRTARRQSASYSCIFAFRQRTACSRRWRLKQTAQKCGSPELHLDWQARIFSVFYELGQVAFPTPR